MANSHSSSSISINPFKWVRSLYDWVLHWAETPYGGLALFILAFAESSFFPIPPDVLLIALAISIPSKSFKFAGIALTGSVLGAFLGYYIGWGLYESIGAGIIEFYDVEAQFRRVGEMYNNNAFTAIAISGFTPIPYKVFTIAAGVFKVSIPILIIASLVGRAGRFFLVGALIWKFGKPIKSFIDKYFNLLTIVFTVLLIGGFIIIKYAF
ncbi:MAG: DedA family protein [Candidatus Marinimicrobia bacterium]|nr:DedA family protein [Candidatus Neomarinimicrobiota bacterium]MCF7828341.1 DedA family protein [Candidatus Neomarinimicrobiota bacterium]MCF7879484.1 DedA family protein [Candidatus Neomarinimicrobiota bacterium]